MSRCITKGKNKHRKEDKREYLRKLFINNEKEVLERGKPGEFQDRHQGQ